MNISGKTKVVALIGYPVEHSLSPAMHNAAFENMGLDYCYVTFAVKPELLREAVEAVRALDLAGINVTVPHKENVMRYLNRVDEEASFIGAVNTVVNTNGKLNGFNTDGRGFMKSLEERGIDPSGKRVFIMGTGGASRAVSYYLSEKAGEVLLYDPDTQKMDKLVADLAIVRKNVRVKEDPGGLDDIDILINATPLGLKAEDPLPCDASLIKPNHTVVDLIYRETPLLRAASARGAKTLNGMGMLLWQGVLAFEKWTGMMPPHELMGSILRDAIHGKGK